MCLDCEFQLMSSCFLLVELRKVDIDVDDPECVLSRDRGDYLNLALSMGLMGEVHDKQLYLDLIWHEFHRQQV